MIGVGIAQHPDGSASAVRVRPVTIEHHRSLLVLETFGRACLGSRTPPCRAGGRPPTSWRSSPTTARCGQQSKGGGTVAWVNANAPEAAWGRGTPLRGVLAAGSAPGWRGFRRGHSARSGNGEQSRRRCFREFSGSSGSWATHQMVSDLAFCSPRWTRTINRPINSRMLCQLS